MTTKRPRAKATGVIITLAAVISMTYLAFIAGTFASITNPGAFMAQQKFDVIGNFLAGFAAPLALIWLITAVLIQRQEIKETRDQFEASQDLGLNILITRIKSPRKQRSEIIS